MDELTNIVQDAATVCRAFGLRYLWVDSLCIMQQHKTDWEEQSYEMNLIFSNSSITFCMPASSICLQSFLIRKAPLQIQIHLVCKSSQTEGTACLVQSGSKVCGRPLNETLLMRDLKASSWNKRGWVFQEMVLSPRKTYFGTEMIYVHVNDTITSENGYSIKEEVNPIATYHPKDYMNVNPEAIIRRGSNEPVFWYEIVRKFSERQWTDNLDVFPALSGIARMFKDIYKDYVAGVWVHNLKCGLIFEIGGEVEETFSDLLHFISSGTRKIGPSWSWASRPRFVRLTMTFGHNMRCRVRSHLRTEFRLLHLQNDIDGTNLLGRIHAASLTISGIVADVSQVWRPLKNLSGYIYMFSPGNKIYLSPDWSAQHGISNEDKRQDSFATHIQLLFRLH
jgi:hypothetical protein